MKAFTIILIVLIVLVLAALLVWYSTKLEKSSQKTFNIIFTVIGTLLLMALLLSVTALPKTTDKLLTSGIEGIRTQINSVKPGSANSEMDATQFKEYLNDSKEMSDYLLENEYASFLTRTFGVRYYIRMFNRFAKNLDANMAVFEDTGTTFSVTNILNYVKDQTVKPVRTAAKVLEIVVTVASALFLILMFVWANSIKKGAFSKGTTFGETVK